MLSAQSSNNNNTLVSIKGGCQIGIIESLADFHATF